MSKIQKELEKLTNIKEKDYKDEQEFLMALMNHINDEGEDFFNDLSEEIQSWFNQNVDCISNSESLIGFDEDVPEENTTEEPFGEDEEKEEDSEEEGEEIDLEDYDEITLEDVKVDQRVLIMLDDESGAEGKVIKKLKVALKILNDEDQEVKIANKKIAAIYLYTGTDAEVNDVDEEEEKSKKMEVVEEKDVTVETKKFIEEDKRSETEKDLTEIPKVTGKREDGPIVNKTPEISPCQCNSSKASMKQVLYHISEIFRIISDEM